MKMLRNRLLSVFALLLLAYQPVRAQGDVVVNRPDIPSGPWTLQKCISYAVDNNISVQQNALRMKDSEVQLSTVKNSRWPSLNASMGGNMNFGRGTGRDGVTRDQTTFSSSLGASTSVAVFNGFRIKNNIETSRLNLMASLKEMEQAAEEVSLSVTSMYLQVLFNREMVAVAQRQVEISRSLVDNNQTKFSAGKIAEADLVESRSQLARDEYNLVQQLSTFDISVLDLKQMLNLPSETPFSVAIPSVDEVLIPGLSAQETIGELYEIAESDRPSVIAGELRLRASQSNIKVAKSQFYPQISASGGYSNGYYNSFADNASNASLRQQFKNNGSEYIGMNISIPIFNRNATRNQVRSAKLNAAAQELSLQQTKLNLRKTIEQSYHQARSAFQQYISSKEAALAAQKSFGYEQERTNAGTSTPYNYDLAKSRLESAESEMVRAKYEFIFRTKILQYYKGEPLAFEY